MADPAVAGKALLLESLAGITNPDKGNIYLEGNEITGKTGFLGYMPQDDLLFPLSKYNAKYLLPVKVKGRNEKEAKNRKLRNYFPFLVYKIIQIIYLTSFRRIKTTGCAVKNLYVQCRNFAFR